MLYIQERENFTMYNNNIFPARANNKNDQMIQNIGKPRQNRAS